jgi:hypothetical protein
LDDIVVYDSCPVQDRQCNFDDGSLCSYVNDVTNQYDWVRTTGDDALLSISKPSIDHTDGVSSGPYAMIDISKSVSNSGNRQARLVEFWYYANAQGLSSASKLNLYVRNDAQVNTTTGFLIWSKNILAVSPI